MKYITFFFFLVLIGNVQLSAQHSWQEDAVLQMFEKPKKVEWVKHFKGRLDDMNDVAVTLAFDGKSCKGELQYLRSKAIFYLVGEIKKGKLSLQEYDEEQRVTGYVTGDLLERGIRGDWQNIDNTIGAILQLDEVKKRVVVPTYCGDNKWIRFYSGNIGQDRVALTLQKTGGNNFTGTALIKGKGSTLMVKGHTDVFDNVYLFLTDEMTKSRGKLEGSFDGQKSFMANFRKKSNGKETTCTFNLNQTLSLGCMEYADYSTNYHVLYPKLKNEIFNDWIKGITEDWMNKSKAYVEKNSMFLQHPKPAQRNSLRAHAWCDIDIVNDDLICGQMNFVNSWELEPQHRNLNFDLKHGKEILIEEIFIETFDYKKYVKNYLTNRLLQHQLAKDNDFRKWLDQQEFNTFTLRRDGIGFATDFSRLYGRQQITIPYKKLASFFKKNDIIQNFLKGKY